MQFKNCIRAIFADVHGLNSCQAFWNRSTYVNRPERTALKNFKKSCVMSDHHLKFNGPGFDFDAKGWLGIAAAIVIVLLVLLVPRLFYWSLR
jgi:hypothetical protein